MKVDGACACGAIKVDLAREKYYTEYHIQVCTRDRESKFKLPRTGGCTIVTSR